MSETNYMKGPCERCGNRIEFPASSAGAVINCPHCAQPTQLRALVSPDPANPAARRPRTSPILIVIVILLLAGAIAGIVFFLQRNKSSAAATLPPSTNAIPGSITNLTTDTSVTPTAQPPPKPVKSLDDLKSSEVIFEKTKGSSLVYASGTITNASDFQRFGIRVELDVFNPKGARIGSAQDYTDLIEPRHEWKFRALLPDPKAASAKIASIKEDQ